jgi:hypothetical protein
VSELVWTLETPIGSCGFDACDMQGATEHGLDIRMLVAPKCIFDVFDAMYVPAALQSFEYFRRSCMAENKFEKINLTSEY